MSSPLRRDTNQAIADRASAGPGSTAVVVVTGSWLVDVDVVVVVVAAVVVDVVAAPPHAVMSSRPRMSKRVGARVKQVSIWITST
jgi:hypothetical protein